MCGIGAVAHKSDNISSILYEILFNLQHRGQDSSGLVTYDFKTKTLQNDTELVIKGAKKWGSNPKHIMKYLTLKYL